MFKSIPYDACGKEVMVYFNLHNHLWSVIDKKTRRLIGHAPAVMLRNFTTKVYESGRMRVLKEQHKNVHAFVCGTLAATYADGMDQTQAKAAISEFHAYTFPNEDFNVKQITYNPYKYSEFVLMVENGEVTEIPKTISRMAILANKKVFVI